jgi:hypothetical protein
MRSIVAHKRYVDEVFIIFDSQKCCPDVIVACFSKLHQDLKLCDNRAKRTDHFPETKNLKSATELLLKYSENPLVQI